MKRVRDLLQRIVQGRSPSQEARSGMVSEQAAAVREALGLLGGSGSRTIWHYLYLPKRKDAATIADELRQQGFRTEERLGADNVNWLVLAIHEAVPSEELFAATRAYMEALVARVGGEYDGWEAQSHSDDGSSNTLH